MTRFICTLVLAASISHAASADSEKSASCAAQLDRATEARVLDFLRDDLEYEYEGQLGEPLLQLLGARRRGDEVQCVVTVTLDPSIGGHDAWHCVLVKADGTVDHPPLFPSHFGLDPSPALRAHRRAIGRSGDLGSAAYEYTPRGWKILTSVRDGEMDRGEVWRVEIEPDLSFRFEDITSLEATAEATPAEPPGILKRITDGIKEAVARRPWARRSRFE
jgi:hypothetical protein